MGPESAHRPLAPKCLLHELLHIFTLGRPWYLLPHSTITLSPTRRLIFAFTFVSYHPHSDTTRIIAEPDSLYTELYDLPLTEKGIASAQATNDQLNKIVPPPLQSTPFGKARARLRVSARVRIVGRIHVSISINIGTSISSN